MCKWLLVQFCFLHAAINISVHAHSLAMGLGRLPNWWVFKSILEAELALIQVRPFWGWSLIHSTVGKVPHDGSLGHRGKPNAQTHFRIFPYNIRSPSTDFSRSHGSHWKGEELGSCCHEQTVSQGIEKFESIMNPQHHLLGKRLHYTASL